MINKSCNCCKVFLITVITIIILFLLYLSITWAQKSDTNATIFTGIAAIIAATIAFFSFLIPELIRNSKKINLQKKIWEGQYKAAMQQITVHVSNLDIKLPYLKDIKDKWDTLRILNFGDIHQIGDLGLSASKFLYPLTLNDLANMNQKTMEAFIDYEATAQIFARLTLQIKNSIDATDILAQADAEQTERFYLMSDDEHSALIGIIQKFINNAKNLCICFDKKRALELLGE